MVPPAEWCGFVLYDDPHRHGVALGPLLERLGMPLSIDICLSGRLTRGRHGLELCANGGTWQLVHCQRAHLMTGRDVHVIGQRTGFNEISCEAIWLAGEPRPRRRQVPWELLSVSAVVVGGYAFMLLWLLKAMI